MKNESMRRRRRIHTIARRVSAVAATLVVAACGPGSGQGGDGSVDLGSSADARVDLGSSSDAGVDLGHAPDMGLPIAGDLRAFPSAEGFGAYASGGRGGQVIHVTNLNAGGPGSLQAAIDTAGPRTIVFDVSGHIPDVIVAETGDFTIAGQTAPGGISIGGLMVQGDVVCEGDAASGCTLPTRHPENFVVRHVHVRTLANDGDGGGDGLRFHHAVNGIVDHVSIGNAEDEAIQISFTRQLTVQHTMLAETIGAHGRYGGMLINYGDDARGYPQTDLSIHHDLWVRIYGRYPEINRENLVDTSTSRIEISNNVYWGTRAPLYVTVVAPGLGHDLPWQLNFVGNYAVDDPNDALSFGFAAIEPPPDLLGGGTMFVSDVHVAGTTPSDYAVIYNNNDFDQAIATMGTPWYSTNPTWSVASRHPFPAIQYTTSGQPLVDSIANGVGAFPRDRFDLRMTGYLRDGVVDGRMVTLNGVGDIVVGNPANDLMALGPFPAAPTDTDRDGIADAWETARGLDPNVAADGNATTLSVAELGVAGYTNLEVYLDWLAHEREAGR